MQRRADERYHDNRDEGSPNGYGGRDDWSRGQDQFSHRATVGTYENDWRQGRNEQGRWGGGSYYGDVDYSRADYGIGLGGWREQGRAMMDRGQMGREDDRRFRSDMPGMGSRGDYGMDDSRRRESMGYGEGFNLGGRSGWNERSYAERGNVGGMGSGGDFSGGYGGYGASRDRDLRGRDMNADRYGMRDVHTESGRVSSQLGDVGRGWSVENGNWDQQRLGRGPRGYKRNDDRIREDICDRLMQSWMNAEDVDVKVEDGEVTLTGQVDNRHEKRAIEDLAEMVLGVRDVHNHLRTRSGLMAKLGLEGRREENRDVHGALSGAGTTASDRSGTGTERSTTSGGSTTTGSGSTAGGGMARASAPGNGTTPRS